MSVEQSGQVKRRMRLAFAASSSIFLIALAISPVKDYLREWKHYEKDYERFAQTRPDTKRLLADFRFGIDQVWIPQMDVVDRCTTCHQGIAQPTLLDAAVPQPFRAHPPIPHRPRDWGCVVCHRGQGLATEVGAAHDTTLAWERPLLPVRYIQASCGICHRDGLPDTPLLNRGRELIVKLNCVGCHRLQGIERPAMLGPDLTNLGTKVSREWIYKWLKEPRTITDSQGNIAVNGVETEAQPRMPQFKLDEAELRALSAFLSSLQSQPLKPYAFDPRVVALWQKRPDAVQQGELRFRQMFCSDCHSLAVTRAGTTELIGGDIGPELTKVGSKVKGDWLAAWLHDPESYLPHELMPRYNWTDEDLYTVSQYVATKLTDPDLLSDVPKLGPPDGGEIDQGRQLFTQKGCASCHAVAHVPPQKDFGPDLSTIGGRTVSEIFFGDAKIPRTLIAYIHAKISAPLSVNPAARMPQYQLSQDDLDSISTALLGMTGDTNRMESAHLVVPATRAEFHPAGEFGKLYERYKCYVCHRFNGYGGTLAPDLSFEGSRAQRQWLISYLKEPGTLRPTLTVRMPRFNMTDAEANTIADYLETVLQAPELDKSGVNPRDFTPQMASLGKQLYEVKYQCRSCHTIGSKGGYVGPPLSNAGNWMTPAWIKGWLENPQALDPTAIEPRCNFTSQEVAALTAYMMTLKQSKPIRDAAARGGR